MSTSGEHRDSLSQGLLSFFKNEMNRYRLRQAEEQQLEITRELVGWTLAFVAYYVSSYKIVFILPSSILFSGLTAHAIINGYNYFFSAI
jgi:hypothetical protein